ncbi:MAG TPA: transglycosylase family protein [Acidimicrobiales bacterium]|nr:transglycosylase family protein [Acidimicrobiales bacterium]
MRPRYVGPINDDTFIRLSWCEAGGRPDAVSRSGKYFGAFQFSLATWHSMGMAGSPVDYPYDTQLNVAKALQARSGWGQWPVCARKMGLR